MLYANLPPLLGVEEMEVLSQNSHPSLAAVQGVLITICTAAEKTPLKRCTTLLPALTTCWVQPWHLPGCLQPPPAESLPSRRQRARPHSGNRRQHRTETGGAPRMWLSRDTSCGSAAQAGVAQRVLALQRGRWGSLAPQLGLMRGYYITTALGMGQPEWRGEAGDNPALLLSMRPLAPREPAVSSRLGTFSSRSSPWSGHLLQPHDSLAGRPAQLGAVAEGHSTPRRSSETTEPRLDCVREKLSSQRSSQETQEQPQHAWGSGRGFH